MLSLLDGIRRDDRCHCRYALAVHAYVLERI
jgi:hypothetical protein